MLTDVHRHGLRSVQLGLLSRWPEFPGIDCVHFVPRRPFSPGCIIAHADQSLQVEYAMKAVENGGTAVGIRCKDGVVLAVEKIITSKLLKPGANKRIATVDRHVGIVRFNHPPLPPTEDRPVSSTSCSLGIGWTCSRRSSLRFQSPRRGVLMERCLQRPHSHIGSRESSRGLRTSLHIVLECTTIWRDRHCRWMG